MIRGQKVILRGKRLEDAENDYAWRSDEELARLDAAPTMRIPFAYFLDNYADELARPSRRRRRFAIETLDGKHIGNCMYYNIDERKGGVELGIMIGDRDYWDQGHGTDVVTTLLNHIFTTTKLERVYGRLRADRARRVRARLRVVSITPSRTGSDPGRSARGERPVHA